MQDAALHDIIDLDRYPVDKPDSASGRALISTCRAALEQEALCALPGFVHREALARMVREAEDLAPGACRYERPRIAYEYSEEAWPEGHPRTLEHDCRYFQILNHQISNDSPLRAIYLWEPLREFLRRVLGYEELHRSTCPHLALSIQIEDRGDCNGWHFDGNDAVFSLLLQEPTSGGHFEYAPYIRNEQDQNYAAVAATFEEPERHSRRPEITAGTFVLFKGDESLHRVTAVEDGEQRRIIALFAYDRAPNQIYQQAYIDELRGKSHALRQP